jgi:hypothetical protein
MNVSDAEFCGPSSGSGEMTILFEQRISLLQERSAEPQVPRLRSG